MNGLGGDGGDTPVTVDISTSDDIKCDRCGDLRFEPVFFIKRISALVSPSGKEGLLPINVFGCLSCGHVNEIFLPPQLRKTPLENAIATSNESPKSNLHIVED